MSEPKSRFFDDLEVMTNEEKRGFDELVEHYHDSLKNPATYADGLRGLKKDLEDKGVLEADLLTISTYLTKHQSEYVREPPAEKQAPKDGPAGTPYEFKEATPEEIRDMAEREIVTELVEENIIPFEEGCNQMKERGLDVDQLIQKGEIKVYAMKTKDGRGVSYFMKEDIENIKAGYEGEPQIVPIEKGTPPKPEEVPPVDSAAALDEEIEEADKEVMLPGEVRAYLGKEKWELEVLSEMGELQVQTTKDGNDYYLRKDVEAYKASQEELTSADSDAPPKPEEPSPPAEGTIPDEKIEAYAKETMSVKEACDYLGTDEKKLNALVDKGELKTYGTADKPYFKKEDVEGIKTGRVKEPTIVLTDSDAEISLPDEEPQDLLTVEPPSGDKGVLDIGVFETDKTPYDAEEAELSNEEWEESLFREEPAEDLPVLELDKDHEEDDDVPELEEVEEDPYSSEAMKKRLADYRERHMEEKDIKEEDVKEYERDMRFKERAKRSRYKTDGGKADIEKKHGSLQEYLKKMYDVEVLLGNEDALRELASEWQDFYSTSASTGDVVEDAIEFAAAKKIRTRKDLAVFANMIYGLFDLTYDVTENIYNGVMDLLKGKPPERSKAAAPKAAPTKKGAAKPDAPKPAEPEQAKGVSPKERVERWKRLKKRILGEEASDKQDGD